MTQPDGDSSDVMDDGATPTPRVDAMRARVRSPAPRARPSRARSRTVTRARAVEDAGEALSHVVHANHIEPSFAVVKLGLSMTHASRAAALGARAAPRSVAWVISTSTRARAGTKATMDEFWGRTRADATRALFPTVEDPRELLRGLYFKAERAGLSERVGGTATCLLLERLMTEEGGGGLRARRGTRVVEVRAMRAPRPLKGGLFANPELVYHDESGRKANLLTHEFGEDIAAKLGTRAAFHQTCVCRLDAKGDDGEDAWIEVDIAGPALDNYEFSPGGVPLCCAPVSAAEREGWTSTVEELVDACSEDELALARDFADRAYAFLQS